MSMNPNIISRDWGVGRCHCFRQKWRQEQQHHQQQQGFYANYFGLRKCELFKALTQATFAYSSNVVLFTQMQKGNTYLAQRYSKKCDRKSYLLRNTKRYHRGQRETRSTSLCMHFTVEIWVVSYDRWSSQNFAISTVIPRFEWKRFLQLAKLMPSPIICCGFKSIEIFILLRFNECRW